MYWFSVSGLILLLHESFAVPSTPGDLDAGSAAIEELCQDLFVSVDESRLVALCTTIRSHLAIDHASALIGEKLFSWFAESNAPLALQLYVGVSNEDFQEYDDTEREQFRMLLLEMSSDLSDICDWS